MDKVKLGKEQLKELKYFIYSRGFREPEVMMEILDHFACKVEDKLTENPLLSLQDAIKEAHKEFGYNGFYSIKASLDVFTRRRYKRIYWQEVKYCVTSVPLMLMIILTGYMTYQSMLWAFINNKVDFVFEDNVVGMSIWVAMIIAELIKGIILTWKGRKSYYISMAQGIAYISTTMVWVILPVNDAKTENGMIVKSIIGAISVAYFIVHYLAHYKMIKAAHKDYEDFKVLVDNENPLQ
jgi:hypothetical protein